MITEYEVKVLRPWAPGMKKDDVITVQESQFQRLVNMNMAVLIQQAKPLKRKTLHLRKATDGN